MTPSAVNWPQVIRHVLEAELRMGRRSGDSSEPLDARLERARGLIDERYDEPWTVEALASRACLSREQFIRAFGTRYGETPHQYLIQRRIEEARRLLESTSHPVTDICLAVGFSSLGSFSTTFRRRVGAPPSHYRRRSVLVLSAPNPLAQVPCCFLFRVGGIAISSLLEKQQANKTCSNRP